MVRTGFQDQQILNRNISDAISLNVQGEIARNLNPPVAIQQQQSPFQVDFIIIVHDRLRFRHELIFIAISASTLL